MFTGQRLKDCVLLRWDKVDLNRKRIWVKQFKTGKEVTIPMSPKLFEVLTEAQEWKTDHYVCPNVAKRYNILNYAGKNVGNNMVNIDVLRVIKWIGLKPSVAVPGRKKKVTVYGFHSLRHKSSFQVFQDFLFGEHASLFRDYFSQSISWLVFICFISLSKSET